MKDDDKLDPVVWGIHCMIEDEHLLWDKSIIAIGWGDLGDVTSLDRDRDAFKKAYSKVWPEDSPQTVATQAGQLCRFVCEAKVGDYVVFPAKSNRTINIGQIQGEYFFEPDANFQQQRNVSWLKVLPRAAFSQGALYEVGSALTFFQIKNYADEYLDALHGKTSKVLEEDKSVALTADEIEDQTKDFILKQLKKQFKGYAFEPVVQVILRAM